VLIQKRHGVLPRVGGGILTEAQLVGRVFKVVARVPGNLEVN
jgi:hypothetical protein